MCSLVAGKSFLQIAGTPADLTPNRFPELSSDRLAGTATLGEGCVPVRGEAHRDRLHAGKRGEMPGTKAVRDETVQGSRVIEGLEMDSVSHDLRKFFQLLLKKNGLVLKRLNLPPIVHTMPEHAKLKAIAYGCFTRHHSHQYFGFTETQWELFLKAAPHRVGTASRTAIPPLCPDRGSGLHRRAVRASRDTSMTTSRCRRLWRPARRSLP